jgi:hypothetical protein
VDTLFAVLPLAPPGRLKAGRFVLAACACPPLLLIQSRTWPYYGHFEAAVEPFKQKIGSP